MKIFTKSRLLRREKAENVLDTLVAIFNKFKYRREEYDTHADTQVKRDAYTEGGWGSVK